MARKVQTKRTKIKSLREKIQKKKSDTEIEIEDRLVMAAKNDHDSIVYIGNLVENTLKGPFGAVIKALTAGRIDMELQSNKDGSLSADRVLGRCEMGSTLWHDLEAFVLEKDAMLKPVRERPSVDRAVAEEPIPHGEESSLA